MASDDLMELLNKLQGASGATGLASGLLGRSGEDDGGAARAVSTAARAAGGGGLTLLPVVGAVLRLFGVGKKKEQDLPPFEKFALPAPLFAEAGIGAGGETVGIDRGIGDRIRTYSPGGGGAAGRPATEAGPAPAAQGAPTITVQVQAMDSQSFLDRRDDIARAVREAVLESNRLNDVVSEL